MWGRSRIAVAEESLPWGLRDGHEGEPYPQGNTASNQLSALWLRALTDQPPLLNGLNHALAEWMPGAS
jgi:hypothetical protein